MHIILLSYSVSDSVVGENVDGGYVLYKRLDYFESLKKKKIELVFSFNYSRWMANLTKRLHIQRQRNQKIEEINFIGLFFNSNSATDWDCIRGKKKLLVQISKLKEPLRRELPISRKKPAKNSSWKKFLIYYCPVLVFDYTFINM